MVIVRAMASRLVLKNRLAIGGRLSQLDIPPNDRAEYPGLVPGLAAASGRGEKLSQVAYDFRSQASNGLEHAQNHPGDANAGINPLLHQLDRFQELAKALQGQEVRLQRDDDVVSQGQGV